MATEAPLGCTAYRRTEIAPQERSSEPKPERHLSGFNLFVLCVLKLRSLWRSAPKHFQGGQPPGQTSQKLTCTQAQMTNRHHIERRRPEVVRLRYILHRNIVSSAFATSTNSVRWPSQMGSITVPDPARGCEAVAAAVVEAAVAVRSSGTTTGCSWARHCCGTQPSPTQREQPVHCTRLLGLCTRQNSQSGRRPIL